jgi:hypothetical protein
MEEDVVTIAGDKPEPTIRNQFLDSTACHGHHSSLLISGLDASVVILPGGKRPVGLMAKTQHRRDGPDGGREASFVVKSSIAAPRLSRHLSAAKQRVSSNRAQYMAAQHAGQDAPRP